MRKVILGLLCVDDCLSKNWTDGAHRDLYGRDSVCSGAGADRKNPNSNKKPLEAQTEALGLQHSQTRTSWTRSHGLAPRHAPPFPALNSRGWRGLTYASVEEADHQCWLVVVSNIVFFRVFSVEYSNMYNLSINKLCILRGNLYICPHNCIVCVRMVISFYPATRTRAFQSRSATILSGAGPARWFGRS